MMLKDKNISTLGLSCAIAHVLLLFLAYPKFLFLGRFPGQDLIWNDLMILKSWNWMSETVNSHDFRTLLFGDTNFRLNFGENMYADSKGIGFLFDPGAWAYLFSNDLQFAIYVRLFIFSAIAGFGIFSLMSISSANSKIKWNSQILFVSVFCILDGGIIFHPQLTYEVGFLNSWFFFLVPIWICLFLGFWKLRINLILATILTLLGVSTTDIHYLIFILSIALLGTISAGSDLKLHGLTIGVFSIFIFILVKLPFFLNLFISAELSHRAAFTRSYARDFLFPLVLTPFSYNFAGPVTLFIGCLVPTIAAWSLIRATKNHKALMRRQVSYFIVLSLTLAAVGVVVHGIEFLAQNMPSLWRYPFGILPFLLISLAAHWSSKSLSPIYSSKMLIGILSVVFLLQNISVTMFTREQYRVTYDKEVRKYFLESLPECIDAKLTENQFPRDDRTVIFAAPSFADDYRKGRDDSLLFLIENPSKLFSRTFNQWRYTSSSAYSKLFGLFSWPALITDSESIKGALDLTSGNVLLTSRKLSQPIENLIYIGRCANNSVPKNIASINETLSRSTFIYVRENSKESSMFTLRVKANQINIVINCELLRTKPTRLLKLPIADRNSLYISNAVEAIRLESDQGLLALSGVQCSNNGEKKQDIILKSHSPIVAISNAILFPILFFLILNRRLVNSFPQFAQVVINASGRKLSGFKRRMRDLNPR